jgi:hypothetical protein
MNEAEKQVWSASAEVVGMALNFMLNVEKTEGSQKWCDAYIGNIHKMLTEMLTKDKQSIKSGIFLSCIHGMQKHYAPVANRFV